MNDTSNTDDQQRLIDFLEDPENLKKAAEGSMEKRAKVLYPDTSKTELDAQLDDIVGKYKLTMFHAVRKAELAERPETVKEAIELAEGSEQYIRQALTKLIAQREQAAELRARIDELRKLPRYTYSNGTDKGVEAVPAHIVDRRIAELEATNPEKGVKQA